MTAAAIVCVGVERPHLPLGRVPPPRGDARRRRRRQGRLRRFVPVGPDEPRQRLGGWQWQRRRRRRRLHGQRQRGRRRQRVPQHRCRRRGPRGWGGDRVRRQRRWLLGGWRWRRRAQIERRRDARHPTSLGGGTPGQTARHHRNIKKSSTQNTTSNMQSLATHITQHTHGQPQKRQTYDLNATKTRAHTPATLFFTHRPVTSRPRPRRTPCSRAGCCTPSSSG